MSHEDLFCNANFYFKVPFQKFGVLFQGKSIAIFYGSQTGTAEEFAGRLSKDAQRYGLKALVLDPEECDMVRSSYQTNTMKLNLDDSFLWLPYYRK